MSHDIKFEDQDRDPSVAHGGGTVTADPYRLAKGSHRTPQKGRCAMEWAAYLAGEPHTDRPACVDPPLREFIIGLNDGWDDEQRQKLRPFLARCLGTANDGRTEERGWLALDWLIREFTPRFLALVPSLKRHADELAGLPPVVSDAAVAAAVPLLRRAREDAVAVWAAGGTAAKDTVWAAGGTAARDTVWAAGEAGEAARAAVWAAAWAAGWDAGEAARAAAGAALTVAGGDAQDVLRPVVQELQQSALDLLDRMLPEEPIQQPVVEDAALVCDEERARKAVQDLHEQGGDSVTPSHASREDVA